jgi:hypothetical protein
VSTPASIKGSIFATAVADVVRLRDAGRIAPDRLDPADRKLLDERLSPGGWYPLDAYARLLALLGEIEGRGSDDYFRERGRANARRLIEAGLYQQLAFIERWSADLRAERADGDAAVASFIKNMKLVISLAGSIYNVGVWEVEVDPEARGRARVVVSDAVAYSEPMRLAAEGFLNEGARRKSDLYRSDRPSAQRILFRMTQDVAELARS